MNLLVANTKIENDIKTQIILMSTWSWLYSSLECYFFTWLAAFLSFLSIASSIVSHVMFQPHISKWSTKQILTKCKSYKSYNTTKEISQILKKCKSYSTTEEISQIWMLQLTYIKESNNSTSLILLATAQRER